MRIESKRKASRIVVRDPRKAEQGCASPQKSDLKTEFPPVNHSSRAWAKTPGSDSKDQITIWRRTRPAVKSCHGGSLQGSPPAISRVGKKSPPHFLCFKEGPRLGALTSRSLSAVLTDKLGSLLLPFFGAIAGLLSFTVARSQRSSILITQRFRTQVSRIRF